ncbi:MAG: hypothetical protein AMXMBFR82_45230 [Candidatus Hydrogenedentota bacterium]
MRAVARGGDALNEISRGVAVDLHGPTRTYTDLHGPTRTYTDWHGLARRRTETHGDARRRTETYGHTAHTGRPERPILPF